MNASGDSANNANKLALIYSRLKALEHEQKDAQRPILDLQKGISSAQVDLSEVDDITVIFRDTTNAARQKLLQLKEKEGNAGEQADTIEVFDADTVTNIRVLLLAEEQYAQSLVASLEEKIKSWHSLKSEQTRVINQLFQRRQQLIAEQGRATELEDICRHLQKLVKEKDALRLQLVQQEKEKTDQLQKECVQSIGTIAKKIDEEESDLLRIAQENDVLKEKLHQFTSHVKLRREKVRSKERARELAQKLEEARRMQAQYHNEQEKLRALSLKSRVAHLTETVHCLRSQLGSYMGKFEEFERTLVHSAGVLGKVDEREQSLQHLLQKMREETDALKAHAAQTDVSIIRAMEAKRNEESDFVQVKSVLEKLDKKCRKLLMKRHEVLQSQTSESQKSNESVAPVVSETSSAATSATAVPSTRMTTPPARRSPTTTAYASSSSMMSSSSSASPARPAASASSLVGEGSPLSSPSSAERKQP